MIEIPSWAGTKQHWVWIMSAELPVFFTLFFPGTQQSCTCPPVLRLGMAVWLVLANDMYVEWYVLHTGRSYKIQLWGLSCFLLSVVLVRERSVKTKPSLAWVPGRTQLLVEWLWGGWMCQSSPVDPYGTCRLSRKWSPWDVSFFFFFSTALWLYLLLHRVTTMQK